VCGAAKAIKRSSLCISNRTPLAAYSIWPIVSASINLALSTDLTAFHDSERSRRLHRELVEAVLDNRPHSIGPAVRNHIWSSARGLVDILHDEGHASGGH
jgi:hypothetical protein